MSLKSKLETAIKTLSGKKGLAAAFNAAAVTAAVIGTISAAVTAAPVMALAGAAITAYSLKNAHEEVKKNDAKSGARLT